MATSGQGRGKGTLDLRERRSHFRYILKVKSKELVDKLNMERGNIYIYIKQLQYNLS